MEKSPSRKRANKLAGYGASEEASRVVWSKRESPPASAPARTTQTNMLFACYWAKRYKLWGFCQILSVISNLSGLSPFKERGVWSCMAGNNWVSIRTLAKLTGLDLFLLLWTYKKKCKLGMNMGLKCTTQWELEKYFTTNWQLSWNCD